MRATELLYGSTLTRYLEKRRLAGDYRPGLLDRMDKIADPIEVLISAHPVGDSNCHVLLTKKPLPEIRCAEVAWKRASIFQSVSGRVTASRPGQRQEDRSDDATMMVSFLHAKQAAR